VINKHGPTSPFPPGSLYSIINLHRPRSTHLQSPPNIFNPAINLHHLGSLHLQSPPEVLQSAISTHRPRNPHLQSPPGIFHQPGPSTPRKRQREPSDHHSNTDPNVFNWHSQNKTTKSSRRSSGQVSRSPAQIISRHEVEVSDLQRQLVEDGLESTGVLEELREGLADGVRGWDAAGREVRGDGSLV